jgi:hypothetical protein
MTLEAIKEAIAHLSPDEQSELAGWITEREWSDWDKQIEADFTPDGHGAKLLAELEREIAEGKALPLADGLLKRRR